MLLKILKGICYYLFVVIAMIFILLHSPCRDFCNRAAEIRKTNDKLLKLETSNKAYLQYLRNAREYYRKEQKINETSYNQNELEQLLKKKNEILKKSKLQEEQQNKRNQQLAELKKKRFEDGIINFNKR